MKKIGYLLLILMVFPLRYAYGNENELRNEIMELKSMVNEQQKQINQLLERVENVKKEAKEEVNEAKKEIVADAKKELKLPEWLSRTKIGGKAYLQYRYELKDSNKDMNDFDVTRFYFTVESDLQDRVSMKMTTDMYPRVKSSDGKDSTEGDYEVRLKHGFLTFKDYPFKDLNILFGQADLPWVPYEEDLWGYRVQGTIFPDREGLLTSTDLGIGVKGKLFNEILDLHLALVNGEGWNDPEQNKYKDFQGRLTFRPFKGKEYLEDLTLSLFGVVGNYDKDEDRNRFISQIAFKKKDFATLAGEYLRARDPRGKRAKKEPSLEGISGNTTGEGFGIFGVVNSNIFGLTNKFDLFGRFDSFDPDEDISNNSHKRYIYGIAYKWNKNLTLLINNQREDFDQGANRKDTNTFFWQAELKY